MTDRKRIYFQRRNVLKLSPTGLVGAHLAALPVMTGAAELPKLALEDPAAKALGYFRDALSRRLGTRRHQPKLCELPVLQPAGR
jgi:hypothetical protein